MTPEEIKTRSAELILPIVRQTQMTDNEEELTLLGLLMMNHARRILDRNLGEAKRKHLFSEFT
jgi:hypothetical protein